MSVFKITNASFKKLRAVGSNRSIYRYLLGNKIMELQRFLKTKIRRPVQDQRHGRTINFGLTVGIGQNIQSSFQLNQLSGFCAIGLTGLLSKPV